MTAVILMGVQASGKTTFYRERFFDTHVRVSLDMLKTRRREQLLIAACLAGQQPFVVDNTNVRAADRAQYIAMAKSSRFRVVGYFLHTELREAIRRNVKRPGKQAIPVRGVVGTFKRVEPPSLEEGFDELYRVRIAEDSSFVVEPWNAA